MGSSFASDQGFAPEAGADSSFLSDSSFLRISGSRLSGGVAPAAIFSAFSHRSCALARSFSSK